MDSWTPQQLAEAVDRYVDMNITDLIVDVDRRAREFQDAPLARSREDADTLAIAARMLSHHYERGSRRGLRHNQPGPRADHSLDRAYTRAHSVPPTRSLGQWGHG